MRRTGTDDENWWQNWCCQWRRAQLKRKWREGKRTGSKEAK